MFAPAITEASTNESWVSEIGRQVKLQSDNQIKTERGPSAHLTVNLQKFKRGLLSQIRCGVLGLEIECGQYQQIPRHERICKLCGKEPETEFHFLFYCEKLQDVRVKLYHKLPKTLE